MDFTGQTIGQYQVVEKLDKDNPGMSEVYRAYNPLLDRQVVIKILAASLARDQTFVQRFQQEARALARLKHPHIVSVYDAGHYAQFDYLVMEYVPGGSLAGLIASEGPLPLERVVSIIKQIASALDYAHEPPRSMVHRDIKPANILLDADGSAKLTDFGLVKVSEVSLTAVGQRFGTPAYMSPEQVLPVSGVGPWTDIYSLGIVAFQMLTKRLPFRGNMQDILDAQLKQPPPSMRSFRPDIPQAVDEAVLKALNKNPTERYSSAGAFAAALEAASRQRPPVVLEPTLPPVNNPYKTVLVEAVPQRREQEAEASVAAPPATPSPAPPVVPRNVVPPTQPPQQAASRNFQAEAPTDLHQPAIGAPWGQTLPPVQPLPPVGQPVAQPVPYPAQETAAQQGRGRLLPILVGLVVALVVLALVILLALLFLRRAPAAGSDPGTSATASAVGAATGPTAQPTRRPTEAATREPTAAPTTAPTSPPTIAPAAVTGIDPTTAFTGTLPIRLTVSGSNLGGVTQALLVAPERAPIPLEVEGTASGEQIILVLANLPEGLSGQRTYELVLGKDQKTGASVTLQDFSERKTAQGILPQYGYTNRIGEDSTSPYTRLRVQPDVGSQDIGTLRNNDQVDILAVQGGWYLLRIAQSADPTQNGIVGWLETWLVDNQGAPPPPPTAPPAPTRPPGIAFGARVDVNYEGSGNSGQFTSCVAGRVTGPGGRVYAGATVNVNNGPNNSFTTRTGGDGVYRVCGLGASSWSVVLQNVPGQRLLRQSVGRVYVNGGSQEAIVNFRQQ